MRQLEVLRGSLADGEACQLAVIPCTQEEWALLGSCSKLMAEMKMLSPSPDAWRVFWRLPQQYDCAYLQKMISLVERAQKDELFGAPRVQGLEPVQHGASLTSKRKTSMNGRRLRRLKQHPKDREEREQDIQLNIDMQSWSEDPEETKESKEGIQGQARKRRKKKVVDLDDVSSA